MGENDDGYTIFLTEEEASWLAHVVEQIRAEPARGNQRPEVRAGHLGEVGRRRSEFPLRTRGTT